MMYGAHLSCHKESAHGHNKMALPKFSQLERNLYAKLFENKASHSDAISDLQARLDEAEEA